MSELVFSVEYRIIQGFPGYRVGDDGSVWTQFLSGHSICTNIWKRMKPSGKRYLKVMLCPGRKCFSIQTLVLEAFVGSCPPGMQACHFPNRDTTDNRLCNLRWGTPTENQADRAKHGTDIHGEQHYLTHLTEDAVREIRRRHMLGESLTALGAEFAITKHAVFRIVKRINWKHIA